MNKYPIFLQIWCKEVRRQPREQQFATDRLVAQLSRNRLKN